MRSDVYEYIQANYDLKRFLREKPIWYRYLSRNPGQLENMHIDMMHYYKKTIPHKVSSFSQSLQLVSMMLGMMDAMRQQD